MPAAIQNVFKIEPEETRALNAAYHQRIHRDQSNLIPLDPEAFVRQALELLASAATSKKAWASWL